MQNLELLLKGHVAGLEASWLWMACSLPPGFCLLALAVSSLVLFSLLEGGASTAPQRGTSDPASRAAQAPPEGHPRPTAIRKQTARLGRGEPSAGEITDANPNQHWHSV